MSSTRGLRRSHPAALVGGDPGRAARGGRGLSGQGNPRTTTAARHARDDGGQDRPCPGDRDHAPRRPGPDRSPRPGSPSPRPSRHRSPTARSRLAAAQVNRAARQRSLRVRGGVEADHPCPVLTASQRGAADPWVSSEAMSRGTNDPKGLEGPHGDVAEGFGSAWRTTNSRPPAGSHSSRPRLAHARLEPAACGDVAGRIGRSGRRSRRPRPELGDRRDPGA